MTRHEQINELTNGSLGVQFKHETVVTWTDERIATVLAARRRDNRLALHRANHTANLIDGTRRGQPTKPERWEAAAYLEQCLERGGDELVNALLYCGHVLTDAEVREFAAQIVGKLRDGLVTTVERVEFEGGEDAA